MTRMIRLLGAAAVLATLALALPGCESDGNAINRDTQNSFLTADDLTTMTDKMAAGIASDPEVVKVTASKPMIVVMQPMVNDTNEYIRGNQKELYVHRVRVLLSSKQALRRQFTFVLNREAYGKLKAEEGMSEDVLGPQESTRLVPEYALKAHFFADTNAGSKQRSDYYLCTYQLTNIATGAVLWEGTYETKKSVKKGMLD